MTVDRGNPALRVRLEPELMERVQSAFPSVKGRSGGAALAIRKLLYGALDIPMPPQYGEIGRAKAVDALEEQLRALEPLTFDEDQAFVVMAKARRLLVTADDAVDILRLRAVLGRLHLWEQPLTDHEKNPKS